ncbi:MAG: hypothetical protein RL701_6845 [Pseudomonadota bacterium]|jgi:hypothetical protein
MAVYYTLDIATEMTLQAVAECVARTGEFTRADKQLSAPDLQISIRKPTSTKISIIEEAFHYRPDLEVDFRLDNLGDRPRAVARVLTGVAAVLRESRADLSLLLNGEEVVLTRLGGKLQLNSIPGFWSEEHLLLMPSQHGLVSPVTL